MKRILSIILVLSILLAVFPVTASAETYSGTCGRNLTWKLDTDTGVLTISGKGDMSNYSSGTAPWYDYRTNIKTVVLEDGVTTISKNAFANCRKLTTINVPNSVTTIGSDAFYFCDSLSSIDIPDSVTSIGGSAFCSCDGLITVTIGSGVTTIGARAFLYCDNLTSFEVSDENVSYASQDGILYSKDMKLLMNYPAKRQGEFYDIPDSVTMIEKYAFYNSDNLTTVEIPDGVTTIGSDAFYDCDSLTSVDIPVGVTTISKNAFAYCGKLTTVNIPDSVKTIAGNAFDYCRKLTTINVPNSVTTIGSDAFRFCDSLTSIDIPDSVTSIGGYAFCSCDGLVTVTIGSGVTTIGARAFLYCNELTDIYYRGTAEQWNAISIGVDNGPLLNAKIHFGKKPSKLKLSLYQIGEDANSDADDVLLPGATVNLYVGVELRSQTLDKDSDGVVEVDLSSLTVAELAAATVSATKSYTHCLTPEDLRYPLFKQFGGNAERYILELHSETIDPNGNWCGTSVQELLNADASTRKLVLKEPRMRVNLAVAYKDVDGTQSEKVGYRILIQKSISQFSQYLAEATDGHVMVNKVLIGTVDSHMDFFFNQDSDIKLAAMADIQIRLDENDNTYAVHSNAHPSGYVRGKDEELVGEEFKWGNRNVSLGCKGKQQFCRISMSGKTYSWNDLVGSDDYAKSLTHEAGHYILGFLDEYMNGKDVKWSDRNFGRPDKAPRNFGLMESEHNEIEISNAASYSYLNGNFNNADINTAHSYYYKKSCEEVLAENFFNRIQEKLGVKSDYSERTGEYRRAKYPYAALSAISDFISFDAEQLAYPAEEVAVMSLDGTDEASLMTVDYALEAETVDSETVQVTTDGYLYFTPAESVYLYVMPEETTEYTFTEGTADGSDGAYYAINQSVIIEAEEGEQTVQGELYSVAPIDEDIDYDSVQWFVCQDGVWQALETDLSREENGNIGARCDYVGAGEYVVMATSASDVGLLEITDMTWSQSTTRDAVVELQFVDQNEAEAVNHYRVYVSDTVFDETMLDQVEFVRRETAEGKVSIELEDTDVTVYVAVVAVGHDGAKSPLSEVMTVTAGAADSDADGLPNWYCDQYQLWETDGEVLPADADKDGDGFTNVEEYTAGTDPTIPSTFVVSFDSDGGSKVAEQEVIRTQTATQPFPPTKDGYRFLGWYNEDVKYDFASPVMNDLTLTAKYECVHENTIETVADNGDKTHTTAEICDVCDEVIETVTAACADEDKDTKCDVCDAVLVTITKFSVTGSNMTLGNELVVNVMFMKNKITGEGNTMEITHGDAVTTIAQENWESYNPSLYVARIPVAAKEMADDLSVVIKNAEGYEISQTYTTSVREYAGKVMTGDIKTYSQEMKNLAVDMLNYGAAAQTNFSYNTEDMANNALTEEQKAWATADVACANNQVKGTNCAGSNLSLESKILLNIVFKLNEADVGDKYAMVTYTDYTGKAVEYRVDSFSRFNASMQGVVVDEIVLADAFELVTVNVYNADGTVYGTGSDSVESYAARTENDLNAAIMKFAASAKTFLTN